MRGKNTADQNRRHCFCAGVTYDKLEPEYMRMAEAERKLRAKQAESRRTNG